MNNNFNKVVAEAKGHFIVNGETYVCWNNKRGYFYCNEKDVRTINVRDNDKGIKPLIMGYWDYALTTFSKEGKAFRIGMKYYEIRHYETTKN